MAVTSIPGGESLHAVSYESVRAGKPAIPITIAPPPETSARLGFHPLMRPRASPEPSLAGSTAKSRTIADLRRDSGLTTSFSTARGSRTTLVTDPESTASSKKSPSPLKVPVYQLSKSKSFRKVRKWSSETKDEACASEERAKIPVVPFIGITTEIPTSNLDDFATPGAVEFSNRGSMLIGGRRLTESEQETKDGIKPQRRVRKSSIPMLSNISKVPSRMLSADDEDLSQKVRSLYEDNSDLENMLVGRNFTGTEGVPAEINNFRTATVPLTSPSTGAESSILVLPNGSTSPINFTGHEERELAGGIEDWHDIRQGDVDRYGFIMAPGLTTSSNDLPIPADIHREPPRLQRVSTALQLASEVPRKSKIRLKRLPSVNGSTRSANTQTNGYLRPNSSQSSQRSTGSGSASRFRSATNRLPHNWQRRRLDEASDMLTLPPALANIAEHDEGGRVMHELKKKEWEREEKWRKMAKVVKKSEIGGGMVFEFDTTSSKLVERTWKGIPDRWRATAWHAFLNASAKQHQDSRTDEELIATFRDLLDRSSPDDVQIDMDVPRTINSHIMFRRRYRGGQRLLFRVLHCLSIYFPDTGYVQGMAALAATFLCYFDEEMTFVMLVRMWQLRGLGKLYETGFGGLMEALDEFEKRWLSGGEIVMKLVSSMHRCLGGETR